MDIDDLWRLAVRSKTLVAAVVLFFIGGATAAAVFLPRKYEAEILLAPVDSNEISTLSSLAGQFGGLAELAGINLPQGSNRSAYVATLRSRTLTDAFLEEKQLLPVLFASEWNAGEGRWRTSDIDKQPALWDGYRLFDRQIRTIEEDRRTGLVKLVIKWRDPLQAAEWANDLVRRANSLLKNQAIVEGEQTIKFLEQQLDQSSAVEIRQALFRLVETETKRIAVAHSRDQYAFRIIDGAVASRKPSSPNVPAILIAGLILGITAAAAAVLLLAARQGLSEKHKSGTAI